MRKKLKILFILILLLVLIAGGFALGVYLRLFDTQALNEEYGLHELPIIGEYFVPPAGTEEHSETSTTSTGTAPAAAAAPKKSSESVKITKEEIEKQQKEREAAEKKRVTKLARLYNDMKPADAAKVMETLDIDLCIAILQRMDESNAAKVITAFEPSRAAEITQIIYEGTPRRAAKARSAAANAPAPGAEPSGNAETQQ
ncbi:hypothetical protein HMPREF9334_01358 [Selenomonas infelix ATCC 43532]|uniref:Magnesium transporter MgtE intracellular domain-containing protein n=1 Tax=Selenomonas infelix ATCC 43532 TaxID=679201 RepID=G5GQ27_9FIRM|nr:hypothetical protein [Selenomonas infelix]EHG20462.1 hypothetical protein HMPREF9334_01358 [Selenomonas infelix ATCC 43532]